MSDVLARAQEALDRVSYEPMTTEVRRATDVEFIAAARTLVPELLAEVERLGVEVFDRDEQIVDRDEALHDVRQALKASRAEVERWKAAAVAAHDGNQLVQQMKSQVDEARSEVERLRDDLRVERLTAHVCASVDEDREQLRAEVERLRSGLNALVDDLMAHNGSTPDDDDHGIICDVEDTIAHRIKTMLRTPVRGDQ